MKPRLQYPARFFDQTSRINIWFSVIIDAPTDRTAGGAGSVLKIIALKKKIALLALIRFNTLEKPIYAPVSLLIKLLEACGEQKDHN